MYFSLVLSFCILIFIYVIYFPADFRMYIKLCKSFMCACVYMLYFYASNLGQRFLWWSNVTTNYLLSFNFSL